MPLWTNAHVIFRRRPPPPHLLVSSNAVRRMPSSMPAPQGPILPLGERAHRVGAAPLADVSAAVRNSAIVIGFLAAGGARAQLSTRVHDVITSPYGCGLCGGSSSDSFAEQFCDSVHGHRRLVQALAMPRPAADPTALLTRAAITAWVRAVGLAAATRDDDTHEESAGLPDWHTPGDM